MRKLTPREAVARAFPSYDRGMADRLIAWLDECGYEIVEKHQDTSDTSSGTTGDRPQASLAFKRAWL